MAALCEYGWCVIRMLPGFERAALDVLHYNESFDGKGYPAGLKGTEIPIVSRIVCVIDAFDAMVSSRPYRKGLPFEEAVRRLNEASGTQFDSAVEIGRASCREGGLIIVEEVLVKDDRSRH